LTIKKLKYQRAMIEPNNERELILNLATTFRLAIEAAKTEYQFKDCRMKNFPSGSCDAASSLLGIYFLENRYTEVFRIIDGEYHDDESSKRNFYGLEDEQSHAWLEVNGYYVDITGDQFLHRLPVDVSPKWEGYFYNCFTKRKRNQLIFEHRKYLINNDDYDKIKSFLVQ